MDNFFQKNVKYGLHIISVANNQGTKKSPYLQGFQAFFL